MNHRSLGFVGTLAASAALSACLVLVLFGSRPTNAGLGSKKHGAVSQDVSVDGQLSKTTEGWTIKFKAINASAKDQDCKVATALRSLTSSPMSRADPEPVTLWKNTMALKVPASGQTDQELAVPTKVAKLIKEPKARKTGRKSAEEFEEPTSYSVHFKANCEAKAEDHIM